MREARIPSIREESTASCRTNGWMSSFGKRKLPTIGINLPNSRSASESAVTRGKDQLIFRGRGAGKKAQYPLFTNWPALRLRKSFRFIFLSIKYVKQGGLLTDRNTT